MMVDRVEGVMASAFTSAEDFDQSWSDSDGLGEDEDMEEEFVGILSTKKELS